MPRPEWASPGWGTAESTDPCSPLAAGQNLRAPQQLCSFPCVPGSVFWTPWDEKAWETVLSSLLYMIPRPPLFKSPVLLPSRGPYFVFSEKVPAVKRDLAHPHTSAPASLPHVLPSLSPLQWVNSHRFTDELQLASTWHRTVSPFYLASALSAASPRVFPFSWISPSRAQA